MNKTKKGVIICNPGIRIIKNRADEGRRVLYPVLDAAEA